MNEGRRRYSRWVSSAVVALAITACVSSAYADSSAESDASEPGSKDTEISGEEAVEYVVEPAGVTVAIGPLVATRAMQMRVASDDLAHEPGIYFGGTARLSIELVDFDSVDATLHLEGEGGYGATRNTKTAAELRRQPVTEWSFLDARLTVQRPLSEAVVLSVGLGAYANSFIVEPNLTYTGHRYIAADMRIGLGWQGPTSNWSVSADLSAYPVLAVNQSNGVYGESSAFGARGGAQIGYNIARIESTRGYTGGRLMLRYDYTRFRTQFPESRIVIDGGVSEDDVHALTLMLGYFM